MKTYLPDVNVWLASTFESHMFHAAARPDGSGGPIVPAWERRLSRGLRNLLRG